MKQGGMRAALADYFYKQILKCFLEIQHII